MGQLLAESVVIRVRADVARSIVQTSGYRGSGRVPMVSASTVTATRRASGEMLGCEYTPGVVTSVRSTPERLTATSSRRQRAAEPASKARVPLRDTVKPPAP